MVNSSETDVVPPPTIWRWSWDFPGVACVDLGASRLARFANPPVRSILGGIAALCTCVRLTFFAAEGDVSFGVEPWPCALVRGVSVLSQAL